MFWRKVQRRFGISAPHLSVRPHVAWYLRWSMMLPFVLAAVGMAWFAYDSGLEFAGFHRGKAELELADLHGKVERLTAENTFLNRKVVEYEQQIQIEQGRGSETVRQMKVLNDEISHLQEDLDFFQNLTATQGKQDGLAIHRLTLERDKIPGEYRVRMLVVQGGQRAKTFVGGYQLIATIVQDGHKTTRVFPLEQSGDGRFELNFKYYQRLEQSVRIPADAQLKNIQVRLFEQGARESSVRQSITLS